MSIFNYMLLFTLFTFSMTVLGSLCVFLFKNIKDSIMNSLLGISSGIMLSSAIFSLLIPAINESSKKELLLVLFFFILGSLFIQITSKYLVTNFDTNIKSTVVLVISIIMHNIPEGASVGYSFGAAMSGDYLASAISLAIGIGIQNIPEGAAISIPLKKNGLSTTKSFSYGVLSGLVEVPSSILGYIFVSKLDFILPYVLSFASGTMLIVIVSELIPDSMSSNNKEVVSFLTILGFIFMLILELYI